MAVCTMLFIPYFKSYLNIISYVLSPSQKVSIQKLSIPVKLTTVE